MIREAGGVPVVTRVGHSLIKQKMLETKAVFGGESSGHFFYSFPAGVFEGPVAAAAQMLQELSKTKKTLSQLVAPFKRYAHSGEINFHVQDKETVLKDLREKYQDGEISELDGVTITYPDFWFNVRPSNTESALRMNLESKNQTTMQAKRDELINFLQKYA